MSSILDALERAAQERSDLRPPPAADSATEVSAPTRRGLWFILGAALVLAALIGYKLLPQPQPDGPISRPPATNSAPVADQAVSAPGVLPVSEPVPTQVADVAPAPDLQSRLRDTGQPSRQSLLANARVTQAAEPVKIEEPESVKADEPVIKSQAAIPSVPSADVSNAPSLSPAATPPEIVEPAVESPPEPTSREAARAQAPVPAVDTPPIPLVWELPQAEREALLELSISIHVYHENPQRRFVIINMHRYVEGDRLKEKGYRLERIDKDGIVLDYGPGLVRIPRS